MSCVSCSIRHDDQSFMLDFKYHTKDIISKSTHCKQWVSIFSVMNPELSAIKSIPVHLITKVSFESTDHGFLQVHNISTLNPPRKPVMAPMGRSDCIKKKMPAHSPFIVRCREIFWIRIPKNMLMSNESHETSMRIKAERFHPLPDT